MYLRDINWFGVMDPNCNKVNVNRWDYPNNQAYVQDVCEMTFQWAESPISLILEKGYDISSQGKLVRFKLNPHIEPQYLVWRASEKAPLLVFDPSRSGVIKDGSQLFGTWTFGGDKPLAVPSDNQITTKPEWKNGFDALKTLDKNSDGVIAGAELNDLALWFDKNSDAESQLGEVVPLTDALIKKLHVGKPQTQNRVGDILVEGGFVRAVKGQEEEGDMVDWFTKTYATADEAIALEGIKVFGKGKDQGKVDSKDDQAAEQLSLLRPIDDTSSSQPLSDENFTGIWSWGMSGKIPSELKDSNKTGMITITDTGRTVRGHLYVEIGYKHLASQKDYRVIISKKFKGEKFVRESDGKVGVRFTTNDDHGETSSEFFKGDRKGALLGTTTNRFTPKNGALASIEYSWEAWLWNS
jgi:hypothetical protein